MDALNENMRSEGLSSVATSMASHGAPDYWIRELGGWPEGTRTVRLV